MSSPEILVEPLAKPYVVTAARRGLHNGLALLAMALSVGLMFLFAATAHTVWGGVWQSLGRGPLGWGLPLGLALLSSWSWMYLLHDRIGLLGNDALRTQLRAKAELRYGAPLPERRHFVELRPLGKSAPLQEDIGWLIAPDPTQLIFLGDRQTITFPRRACTGLIRTEANGRGLLPTWVEFLVFADWRGVSFLCRDTARSQSETSTDAKALFATLDRWWDEKPAPETLS